MKKGFTLIELLSVIVILAVITLIAVPVISGIVTKVRLNALKSSAYGLMEASDLYHAHYSNDKSVRFDIDKNKVSSNDTDMLLTYNGEVKEGTVIINKKGETSLCITDGKNSVYKNYSDKDVIAVANKKCTIPSSTYVVYLDNNATLNELSNQELTELVRQLQEQMDSKADKSALETTNSNLEAVATVASSATLDKTYPVGSIYVSVSSTSPATLFGGTWERIQDTFLLAAGSTYAAGSTGGSATNSHTHSVTASGTVGNHTLTISEIPSHTHTVQIYSDGDVSTGGYGGYIRYGRQNLTSGATGGGGAHNHTFTGSAVTSGGASDTNNMPPYLSVYVWKRTA